MSYNRYPGEEHYYKTEKISPRREKRPTSTIIIILLSLALTAALGTTIYLVIAPRINITNNPPPVNNGVVPASTPINTPANTPAQTVVVTSAHLWNSNPVQSGQVQGPAVISGDFDVNGISVHQGLRDEGTVIILADNATYTLSGPNEGTIYTPDRWQPTLPDLQAKAQAIVNDQHLHGCAQGCTNSLVATFQNGKETSSGVQNSG